MQNEPICFRVPTKLLRRWKFTLADKMVLTILATYALSGYEVPPIYSIGNMVGISDKTVMRSLSKLKAASLIKVRHRGAFCRNRYTLTEEAIELFTPTFGHQLHPPSNMPNNDQDLVDHNQNVTTHTVRNLNRTGLFQKEMQRVLADTLGLRERDSVFQRPRRNFMSA